MPWVQRARVVTPALIGGSGRAPREPLALASKRTSVRPSLGLRFPSQKRIVGCVSKVDRPRPCKQRPLAGSIPVTSTWGMHRAVGSGCIGCYTGERLRVRSTCAQCVARPGAQWDAPAPSYSPSPLTRRRRKSSPTKKGGARGGSHPLPPPRDLDFSPSDEVAGHNLTGSRDSLVAAAPPGRSEQNRSSPLPLTVNDASEGFSFL